jgi:hypothetical protein
LSRLLKRMEDELQMVFFVMTLEEDVFSPLKSKSKLKEEEEDADSFKQMI